ncbi:sigma-70 family RNA polymerase sigma factor [Halomonas almeriensis]|uniref:sigma-70 family RNA polymerase sigma factor n=1 Tax=Halomonas almeriensis TaxID=308163 RepID=UPI0025B3782D|nr:sigma-70 family RNA polymerase sigma factor [Halomonas almeriensis]MDN3552573.1 sigma-70 family RNA polymerase sigma factor [Halomonas almeriensis]
MAPSEVEWPDSTGDHEAKPSASERQQRLEALRPRLISFARLQLRDAHEAEDIVQETMIAAIEKSDHFDGHSRYETWVFGILKHKILDAFRTRKRQQQCQDWEDPGIEAEVDQQFQDSGRWAVAARPRHWGDPAQTLASERFWQVFDVCMTALPEKTARIFTMREFLGLSTSEVCEEAGIKENNCWIILHRARLKLRACLEKGWLTEE